MRMTFTLRNQFHITSFKLAYKACRLRREGFAILLADIPKHPSYISTEVSWHAAQFNDSVLVLHLVSTSRGFSYEKKRSD